ncbi:hypothetical protein [Paenibacillus ihuae]|uniref:hypothetical protein n=1 Tax=Paenibacillus ihuae TaxID=1232431 RepID=UPI0006D5B1F0|nr:hypothetical protein [Paenibacillus ihuae]
MSISASIDIVLSECSRSVLSAPDLLVNFVSEGWDFVDGNGEVTMLPLGDNDDFNWTSISLDRVTFFNILQEKQNLKEIIGIELLRVDSDVGCELLIFNTNDIALNLSIARKKIDIKSSIDITDFSWYLKRILPVYKNSGLQVERINCNQL